MCVDRLSVVHTAGELRDPYQSVLYGTHCLESTSKNVLHSSDVNCAISISLLQKSSGTGLYTKHHYGIFRLVLPPPLVGVPFEIKYIFLYPRAQLGQNGQGQKGANALRHCLLALCRPVNIFLLDPSHGVRVFALRFTQAHFSPIVVEAARQMARHAKTNLITRGLFVRGHFVRDHFVRNYFVLDTFVQYPFRAHSATMALTLSEKESMLTLNLSYTHS